MIELHRSELFGFGACCATAGMEMIELIERIDSGAAPWRPLAGTLVFALLAVSIVHAARLRRADHASA